MNSFENFVWDCFIKSHENSDSLIEATINFSDSEKIELINNLLQNKTLWGKIYDNRVNYLHKHTNFRIDNLLHSIEKIDFHSKYGWSLKSGILSAYLGKASIYEGVKINIGNHSYISGNGIIRGTGTLEIGSYCSIAYNLYANVSNNNHPINYPASINFANEARLIKDNCQLPLTYGEMNSQDDLIKIGNDVWIGHNVTIFNRININNGCVIGAHSIVTKDCEPYGIYAGAPAKLIRFRFSEKIIAELENIRWWDWSIEKIKKNIAFFNLDLTKFNGDLYKLIQ